MNPAAKLLWVGFGGVCALVAAFWLFGCGPYVEQSRTAQVQTARVSQEIACQRHLERFLEGRNEWMSCEEAKARASRENPLCNLSFTCKDGGAQ